MALARGLFQSSSVGVGEGLLEALALVLSGSKVPLIVMGHAGLRKDAQLLGEVKPQ